MSEIWAIIVGTIVLLIVYGLVSSKLKAKRQRETQAKAIPFTENGIRAGVKYNVHLSNGHKLLDVEIVGIVDPERGQFYFDAWEKTIVFLRESGKRTFLRLSAVRMIEEI